MDDEAMPVVIVHGLGDSPKMPWWGFLKKYIWQEEYDTEIHSIDLSSEFEIPFENERVKVPGTALGSVKEYAEELGKFIEDLESDVMIIAHSLGGLVSRWYIEELGGEEHVSKLVTLATPHQGTYLAYMGLVSTAAREMLPSSELVYELNSKPLSDSVDYTAVWSSSDHAFIQKWRAKLPENLVVLNENARNVFAGEFSHLELVYNRKVFNCYRKYLFDQRI